MKTPVHRLIGGVAGLLVMAASLPLPAAEPTQGLHPSAILRPAPDTWPTYSGDYSGYKGCINLSACVAEDCSYYGFYQCRSLSSCQVYGGGGTYYGVADSSNISATHVENCDSDEYHSCVLKDDGSCD